MSSIPVIDVFAGPGGLNEGFSSLSVPDAEPVFSTMASIEMDPTACKTLRLRAAVRKATHDLGTFPSAYLRFLEQRMSFDELLRDPSFTNAYAVAEKEVHQFELARRTRADSDALIRGALGSSLTSDDPWVLIGGPPCQAYSLAGRSRRTNDLSFQDDHKHTLYKEYLNVIKKFRPPVFVMENVKGMLSSQHSGAGIFQAIRADLADPSPNLNYDVRSFVVGGSGDDLNPSDFIIRSENFGIPQTRHRVILLGVRSDVAASDRATLRAQAPTTVHEAIGDLPRIRSGVSPRSKNPLPEWTEARLIARALSGARDADYREPPPMGTAYDKRYRPTANPNSLGAWLGADAPRGIIQHESRFHMSSDLQRYAFLAYEAGKGRAPRVNDLPEQLAPKHRNAGRPDTPFTDRFRVQQWHRPSSTVTSHIAKDGHYYIHPDPEQMRSLSVREAARLQTFPDNYFFMGNRTQQYHQVGNAVPPLLARQLATVVADVLGVEVTR